MGISAAHAHKAGAMVLREGSTRRNRQFRPRSPIGERSFHWCDPKANWPLVGRIKDQPDSQNIPGRFGRHPFVTQSWPNSVILNRTCPAKRAGLFVASSRRALAGYSAPF